MLLSVMLFPVFPEHDPFAENIVQDDHDNVADDLDRHGREMKYPFGKEQEKHHIEYAGSDSRPDKREEFPEDFPVLPALALKYIQFVGYKRKEYGEDPCGCIGRNGVNVQDLMQQPEADDVNQRRQPAEDQIPELLFVFLIECAQAAG